MTNVKAEAGAASVTFEVPAGVAVRIRNRMALGSSQIDESRFPRVGDIYQSLDYATAENRIDMDIQGGVGSVKVVGGPSAARARNLPGALHDRHRFATELPDGAARVPEPHPKRSRSGNDRSSPNS